MLSKNCSNFSFKKSLMKERIRTKIYFKILSYKLTILSSNNTILNNTDDNTKKKQDVKP